MPSPIHITPFNLALWYDLDHDAVGVGVRAGWKQLQAGPHQLTLRKEWNPDIWYPLDANDPAREQDDWLSSLLGVLEDGSWLIDNWDRVLQALATRGYHMDPPCYEDYERSVETPEGITVEVDTRAYPGVRLHELTRDRAIHINVAARPPGAEHRTHIGEAKLRLGEHAHRMAYQLVDYLCDRIERGEFVLEPASVLELEDLSPDEIEKLLAQR